MTTTTDTVTEGFAALRAPFPATAIGKLPRVSCRACSSAPDRVCSKHTKTRCPACGNYMTTAHIDLDYVGHAEVTDRLLSVDPRWSWEPLARDEHGLPIFDTDASRRRIGLWIALHVLGVTRLGYGSVAPGAFDAEKQLIGDAIRNAAMRYGVALDLWAKGDLESAEAGAGDSPPTASPEEDRPADPEWLARFVGAVTEQATAAGLDPDEQCEWIVAEATDGRVSLPEALLASDQRAVNGAFRRWRESLGELSTTTDTDTTGTTTDTGTGTGTGAEPRETEAA